MSDKKSTGLSRRDVLKATGAAAAVGALAGVVVPQVHAGGSSMVKVALVGCGGRGTGAVENALSTRGGPIQLVAMADVFPERLRGSFDNLTRTHRALMDVPNDRKFIGFDGYRHAMDSLRRGDIVILTTPPAFRWAHFTYAIERGLNVFMEKPVTVDGPSTRRMFDLATRSERAGLKVGVGLMCRHCDARTELFRRIRDGAIGDITLLRAYRITGPTGSAFTGPKPAGISELMYQIQRFHAFLWLSGGAYSDFLIHNIDECCWMKDAWPVSAKGFGGRHFRGTNIDQNFDTYSTEYTFADGTMLLVEGRGMPGCHSEFASYAHGTRGSAVISRSGHAPSHARTFRGHNVASTTDITWRAPAPEPNPYQLEWDHLLDAIRNDRAYNEVRRGAEASLITSMGRMASHTGQIITRDQMLACEHEFAPNADRLTLDGESPLRLMADGKYPIPNPGITVDREYEVPRG